MLILSTWKWIQIPLIERGNRHISISFSKSYDFKIYLEVRLHLVCRPTILQKLLQSNSTEKWASGTSPVNSSRYGISSDYLKKYIPVFYGPYLLQPWCKGRSSTHTFRKKMESSTWDVERSGSGEEAPRWKGSLKMKSQVHFESLRSHFEKTV